MSGYFDGRNGRLLNTLGYQMSGYFDGRNGRLLKTLEDFR